MKQVHWLFLLFAALAFAQQDYRVEPKFDTPTGLDPIFERVDAAKDQWTGEQDFEVRRVDTGLSDGIVIEVLAGLTEEESVKDPGSAGEWMRKRRAEIRARVEERLRKTPQPSTTPSDDRHAGGAAAAAALPQVDLSREPEEENPIDDPVPAQAELEWTAEDAELADPASGASLASSAGSSTIGDCTVYVGLPILTAVPVTLDDRQVALVRLALRRCSCRTNALC